MCDLKVAAERHTASDVAVGRDQASDSVSTKGVVDLLKLESLPSPVAVK